jgi:hypothetical protein
MPAARRVVRMFWPTTASTGIGLRFVMEVVISCQPQRGNIGNQRVGAGRGGGQEPDPRDLMWPYRAELMRVWPTSTNKPENDDPGTVG